MLKRKRIVLLISLVTFLASYFALFYLITFNGAGNSPEAFFLSISHFSFDPTEAIHAFYNISPQITLVLIILTGAYWFIYRSYSGKSSLQKGIFYLVITFFSLTVCLSIMSHVSGTDESAIIGVSYLLAILAFKNYSLSIILILLMIYPLYKKGIFKS